MKINKNILINNDLWSSIFNILTLYIMPLEVEIKVLNINLDDMYKKLIKILSRKFFPKSGRVWVFMNRKAYCVLKRKVAKMRFLPKNDDLFWGKNVRGIRI